MTNFSPSLTHPPIPPQINHHYLLLTFNKHSQRQHEAVQTPWHQLGDVGEDVHHTGEAVEEVHGGVLPVHQLHPVAVLPAVEVQVRTIRDELLRQHPCTDTQGHAVPHGLYATMVDATHCCGGVLRRELMVLVRDKDHACLY